jgi:cell division transport system permease protein
VNAWLRHHLHSMLRTLGRLASTPIGTALNVVVIGVALALPLGAYVLLVNLQSLAGGFAGQAQVSLFLDSGATGDEVRSIEDRLRRESGVKQVHFVPRATALNDLARSANLAEVIGALRENPLPDAIIVTLDGNDAAIAEHISDIARGFSKVTHAQTDSDWTRRLDALLRLGRTGLVLLGALLSVALIAVTFNTIRLQIVTQRDEIEVSRLIGATDSYIQRPFFYLGGFLGILGGLVALGLVFAGLLVMNRDVAALAALYRSQFRLTALGTLDCLAFLLFSGLLGWLGSYLSVSIHLHTID